MDEINQGMDATNERNIFELLLKEATKPGSAQYLFVTPKVRLAILKCYFTVLNILFLQLPRGLNYNKHLCVSVVHNSASIEAGVKFTQC